MMRILGLIGPVAMTAAAACSSVPAKAGKCEQLLRTISIDGAKEKAELAVNSGAPYLLAVQGYAISFPGLDDVASPPRMKYKIMEGTTDAIQDGSCRRYQEQARKYAEKFNRRILELTNLIMQQPDPPQPAHR